MNIYLIDTKDKLGNTLKLLKPFENIILLDSKEKNIGDYLELYQDKTDKVLGINPVIIEWKFPLGDLKKITNLKGICTKSSWGHYIDIDYCKKEKIPVCNAFAANSQSVAEYAIWQMLSLARKYPLQLKDGPKHILDNKHQQVEVADKTMGIIGLGNVGSRIAKMGNGLGMEVIYSGRSKKNVPYKMVSLEELLKKSDFVFNCLEICPGTKSYLNKEVLKLLPKISYYISVMGGAGWGIEDIDYLIDRVNKGTLAGVSVENEHGEGYKLPKNVSGNVFIPAAYAFYTKDASERTIDRWTESIISCVKGKPVNLIK